MRPCVHVMKPTDILNISDWGTFWVKISILVVFRFILSGNNEIVYPFNIATMFLMAINRRKADMKASPLNCACQHREHVSICFLIIGSSPCFMNIYLQFLNLQYGDILCACGWWHSQIYDRVLSHVHTPFTSTTGANHWVLALINLFGLCRKGNKWWFCLQTNKDVVVMFPCTHTFI